MNKVLKLIENELDRTNVYLSNSYTVSIIIQDYIEELFSANWYNNLSKEEQETIILMQETL